ncbi:MAG: hypothetical protein BGO95_00620 [Micrococcales bacterium 73-13]|nr:MAG: hypothetical protein BGO95_00620 [Micrococcales bacterium 73-13]
MDLVTDLIGGMGVILRISLSAWVVAVVLGFFISLGMRSRVRFVRELFAALTAIQRGTPELLLIYLVYYGLSGVAIRVGAIESVVIAIGFVYAGYAAEIYHSGFLTVPRGQLDAARAIGLSRTRTVGLVILPQAARFAIAPLASLLLGLMKVATYGSAVGVAEVVYIATTNLQRTGDITATMLAIAVIYIVVTIPIAWGLRRLEQRLRVGAS